MPLPTNSHPFHLFFLLKSDVSRPRHAKGVDEAPHDEVAVALVVEAAHRHGTLRGTAQVEALRQHLRSNGRALERPIVLYDIVVLYYIMLCYV